MQDSQHVPLSRRCFLWRSLATGGAVVFGSITGCRVREKCSLESLRMVPRAGWGAAEPDIANSAEGFYDPISNPEGWLVYGKPLEEVLTTIVVHHSAMPTSDGPRQIQQAHRELRHYADIAYHFVIDAGGWIYEGRSLNVRGSHTLGHNTGTVGVVLLGDFQLIEPTQEQMETLRVLSACLIDRYGITYLAGHRDFQPGRTECPGINLARLLPQLAFDLGITFGTAGYRGP